MRKILTLELTADGKTWTQAHPACAYWYGSAIEALKKARGFSGHRIVLRDTATPYATGWGRA